MELALKALEIKNELREKIERLLSVDEKSIAKKDHHASRPPRPCGLTVHTAVGCIHECRYCYIYDMGFKPEVRPYPLTGVQLVYSLLSNKYFIPGLRGTYLAFGSVTEPFHPLVKERTLEYIENVYTYLGNPVQFSTKMYLSSVEASKLFEISHGKISPLVTIVTLENANALEPRVPSPDKRFETLKNLRNTGLKPFLFLRPIIPGLTEKEYKRILDHAAESGAVGVVAGGLRVTKNILERLREAGMNTEDIKRRLKISIDKMKPGIQYDVETGDIKARVAEYARRKGLIFFPSACMANLYTHGLTCWRMLQYGFRSSDLREPTLDEVRKGLNKLKISVHKLLFDKWRLIVGVDCRSGDPRFIGELLRSAYMACTRVECNSR